MAEKTKSIAKVEQFTRDQVELIKKTVAVGATDDELKLFLYTANRTGLDPLARQIYFIKRRSWNKQKNDYEEKVNIQSSIDGFRVVAERSGTYAGQDEPEFVEDDNGNLIIAKVKVYRFSKTGERYQASVGVAYWGEYCPQAGNDWMWQKLKHTMLSKVAEALALRKAFPQDLSGVYTGEEMAQAVEEAPVEGNGKIQAIPAEDIGMMTTDQDARIRALIRESNIQPVKLAEIRKRINAGEVGTKMTEEMADLFERELKKEKAEWDNIPVIGEDEPTPAGL